MTMLTTGNKYNSTNFLFEQELERLCQAISDSDSDTDSETESETDESEYDSDDSSYTSSDSTIEDEDYLEEMMQEFNVQNVKPMLDFNANAFPTLNTTHTMVSTPAKRGGRRNPFTVYVQGNNPTSKAKVPVSSSGGSETPQATLMEILEGVPFPQRNYSTEDWNRLFLPVTEARVAAYSMQLTKAVRAIDMETLKTYPPEVLNACNSHGESLVNIVCRRNDTELLEYFLSQGASLAVRDDYHKNPMHDACWSREPNFGMIKRVLQEAPWLLLNKDLRGFTPLDYVPKDLYEDWNAFLLKHKSTLRFSFQSMGRTESRERLEENLERLSGLLAKHG